MNGSKEIFTESTILNFGIKCEFVTKTCSNCCIIVFMKKFYFFLLKTDHFWSSRVFKEVKIKGKFSDNLRQNIR